MKTVTIPNDYDPYIVEVNGKTYKLPAGATMSVPDEVAAVINNYYKLSPKEKPVDGGVLPYVDKDNDGDVLKVKGGVWSAEKDAGGMDNPMTTAGDIIIGGASGVPDRLGKGTEGQVLTVGGSGLEWGDPEGTTYTAGTGIDITSNTISVIGTGYLTTAPTEANTDGDLKFVVLSSEPATKYAGYIYMITE